MNTKAIITAILMYGMVAGAATFESIPFNTPTYLDDDPLGVGIITNTVNKVIEVEATANSAAIAASTAQSAAEAAQSTATAAATVATSVQTKASDIETSLNTFKENITNAVVISTNGTVVVGSMKGTPEDVGLISSNDFIVLGVDRSSDELVAENGQILMSADSIKFDAGLGSIFIGDATLESLLQGSGSGESNTIVTVKTNGVALVPDANRAIDITIPDPTEIPLDGKLDATNGVAFGDLKVYQMPSGTVGQTHTIITHESISIGDAVYRDEGITYNGETYKFSSDTNGLARLKDIPTISTNGVAIAPDDSKNVNIVIPAPGEGNVIEAIKTNGVAVAISSNKEVDIAIPTVPDISGLATKQEVSELTITTAKVTDLDSYKNPAISSAALTAIDGINNAQDIATIKSTLTNFLQQFVIQQP